MQHPTLVHAMARERQLDLTRTHEPGVARILDDSRQPAAAIRTTEPREPAPWPVHQPPELGPT